jgi:hypothetical protein
VYSNNAGSCSADGNECTSDVCSAGSCTHPAKAGSCSDDGDPCTADTCSAGSCTHADVGTCSKSNYVAIFTNRNSKYVVLSGGSLMWTGATLASAEVFEKVGEVGTRLLLRSTSTDQYVTLDANDQLVLVSGRANATTFDAPTCDAPFVGLRAIGDTDGNGFVAADAGDLLNARSGSCGAGDSTAWEKFKLVPVTDPCATAADCDDGNPCTDETCVAGYCSYADNGTACSSDGSSCTTDVCLTGSCTHAQDGSCGGTLVAIFANRSSTYVVLSADYLQYTATLLASAETFEKLSFDGSRFMLRAASTGNFVRLDGNDELLADASYAQAMRFDSYACDAPFVALEAGDDDDNNRTVAADANSRLKARSGSCGVGDATAWEKFQLVGL